MVKSNKFSIKGNFNIKNDILVYTNIVITLLSWITIFIKFTVQIPL